MRVNLLIVMIIGFMRLSAQHAEPGATGYQPRLHARFAPEVELIDAVVHARIGEVERLLRQYWAVGMGFNFQEKTLLHRAIEGGSVAPDVFRIVRLLLNYGANPLATNGRHQTPLMMLRARAPYHQHELHGFNQLVHLLEQAEDDERRRQCGESLGLCCLGACVVFALHRLVS